MEIQPRRRRAMEVVPRRKLQLYSGRSHPALAEDIAANLGVELGDANLKPFADGSIHCRYGESVRGADVFIVQTHASPVNEAIMEQLIMIDAAKRGSAKRITAVCPYFGYSRQDRKAEGREPITAKLVADLLTVAGANRIVSVDLHSGQIQGFFDGPVDHLTAMPVLVDYLEANTTGDVVVVSPDTGRVKVAERFSRHLDADLAAVYKKRSRGLVEARGVMGEVAGRHCVLIDDMIDTAGTMVAAADILRENGATDVWAMATHGVLSDPAVDRLKNSVISRLVVTDTLPLPSEKQLDMIEVLSVAGIIADAIDAVFEAVRRDEVIGAGVPIHLIGEAEEVHRADGLVEQQLFALAIRALPGDIPPGVEVDISAMTIGDTIRVSDIKLPPGVSTEVEGDEPVVVAAASRLAAEIAAVEEEAAAAAAEAAAEEAPEGAPEEAPEAAAPAEGEAPAGGEGGEGSEG